jgi:KipI family sensor histidine kinase inhibitor
VDVRRYGTRALLVSPRVDVPRTHPDVVGVVPGAETVLVVVRRHDALTSVGDWIAALGADVRTERAPTSGSEVVVDVVYDGVDLEDVAAATGMSVAEVVALHAAGRYRCDFCGFAPGFGYLSGLDQRLVLPRRATPRTSVPAGSVAIAGAYTGVYPSASPGGWLLLGRTDAPLWDLDRDPPALIGPGTTVRFQQVGAVSGRPRPAKTDRTPPRPGNGSEAAQIGRRGVLRVVAAGVATSWQDHGRAGFAHLAVPASGAVDRSSADLVNRLVGNDAGAAVLETAGGLVLEAVVPVVVADSTSGALHALTRGERLRLEPAEGEVWAYLAVRGGFAARRVLGSLSWDTLSRLGPHPPEAGDVLAAGRDPGRPVATDHAPRRPAEHQTVVRVRVGPRADWIAPHALDQLTGTLWTVETTSRVGVRLDGAPLERARRTELPSEGLVTGAIQVPPDGRPVVMLADHPTTGGYPVLAVVEESDLGWVAQRPPGSGLRFRIAY